MSHYSVAVITKDGGGSIPELMAPFDEALSVDPYISRTKREIIESAKEMQANVKERNEKDSSVEIGEGGERLLSCKTDEEFYVFYRHNFDDEDYDEEGNELSTYNPNSKWDWYEIGGRFSSLIKTKDGRFVDSCKIKNMDLTPNQEVYEEALRFWEIVVDHAPLKKGEKKPINFYRESYYEDRYGSKEKYARALSKFKTYAILMPDGIWYEPGQMGMWGMSFAGLEDEKNWDEKYMDILNSADPEWTITIIDCHI